MHYRKCETESISIETDLSVWLNRFVLGWRWAYGVWQSKKRHGQKKCKTQDESQQGPYEKAKIFLQIIPLIYLRFNPNIGICT